MTTDVDRLVQTLLYEGYVLWPYRRSALKNRQRWTFGGVHPERYSAAGGGTDRCAVQTELLIQGAAPAVDVELRFLHVLDRRPAWIVDGARRYVDVVGTGRDDLVAWDEARERRIVVDGLSLDSSWTRDVPVRVAAREDVEIIGDAASAASAAHPAGVANAATTSPHMAVVRDWEAIEGRMHLAATRLGDELTRLTVRVENRSNWPGTERTGALRRTLVAATVVATVREGRFVSQLDPPDALAGEALACRNEGLWPVLVGSEGQANVMVASPIILYDHPQIAPESPGDLFDATEIDQMLVLNVLALSDDEKDEIRATDPRVRELLERTEMLGPEAILGLGGTFRDVHVIAEPPSEVPSLTPAGPFDVLDAPGPQDAIVVGGRVGPGSRVRIRPRAGGDVFDTVLADRVGIVESIEHDVDGGIHVAITVEDDPGRDLGMLRMPGHRFFYAPDELEWLAGGAVDER